MNKLLEAKIKMAKEAIQEYNDSYARGEGMPFPQWAEDYLSRCGMVQDVLKSISSYKEDKNENS